MSTIVHAHYNVLPLSGRRRARRDAYFCRIRTPCDKSELKTWIRIPEDTNPNCKRAMQIERRVRIQILVVGTRHALSLLCHSEESRQSGRTKNLQKILLYAQDDRNKKCLLPAATVRSTASSARTL